MFYRRCCSASAGSFEICKQFSLFLPLLLFLGSFEICKPLCFALSSELRQFFLFFEFRLFFFRFFAPFLSWTEFRSMR